MGRPKLMTGGTRYDAPRMRCGIESRRARRQSEEEEETTTTAAAAAEEEEEEEEARRRDALLRDRDSTDAAAAAAKAEKNHLHRHRHPRRRPFIQAGKKPPAASNTAPTIDCSLSLIAPPSPAHAPTSAAQHTQKQY